MERADVLLTIAQIALALAGFSGLVTLLGRPSARGGEELNQIRFRSMVELSLLLAAFALFPFLPGPIGLDEPASWRLSSGVYAAASAVFAAHSVRRNRRRMGRVLVAGATTAILFVTLALQASLLGADAAGLLPGREPGAYLVALFVHFLGAAFFFIRLLYGALPGVGSWDA
ncbi:MAG TPA: hypothetical protein VMW35_01380 [Myxococcota bacterium]|nr:hypothetical protein [Myxococcota bacterium]